MSEGRVLVEPDSPGMPFSVLREALEFGRISLDIVGPPRRFWSDEPSAALRVQLSADPNRVRVVPTPAQILGSNLVDDNWSAQGRRSLAKLRAYFLICEDPQRRLDARHVATLSHQVSLVRHVLEAPDLRRVLIADEVGLGKTVEAGMIVKELLEGEPGLRVLYLAPAGLVGNVLRELDNLELSFRRWSTDGDARLSDNRVVASFHRAVHPAHRSAFVEGRPWDVLIVDECHHLTAWEADGGDPGQRYRLVQALIDRQPDQGRLILMSGTPHQGNPTRFENLLALLRRKGEPLEAVEGRVIYRTKEDVRDWDGNPLFPLREVRPPLVIDLGEAHSSWIKDIHDFYRPTSAHGSPESSRRRAAGWRCAQALQWAASSPQAGLGYLVRQAIRGGMDLSSPALLNAVEILRPYRLGDPNEAPQALFKRLVQEVERQRSEADLADIENDELSDRLSQNDRAQLSKLLIQGVALCRESPDAKWTRIKESVLDPAGREKVVLFAQPIETVTALARYLRRSTGRLPAMIIGGQSEAERNRNILNFWEAEGPQFLVSSRAGGEGRNLQIARRLVHVDVPWNPMDLEQRVGRIHRFGSRYRVIVDTVVVKNSREEDAYRVARDRLRLIASTLGEPERFELLFGRVMSLVSPEELQAILTDEPFGPLSNEERDRVGKIVQKGFSLWKGFHDRFATEHHKIKAQDPGQADWNDVNDFLLQHAGAMPRDGFSVLRFRHERDDVISYEEPARVLELEDRTVHAVGDYAGVPLSGPDGNPPRQAGLNVPALAERLRTSAFPGAATGSAWLRVPAAAWPLDMPRPDRFAVLAFARQTLRSDPLKGWMEQNPSLHCFVVTVDSAMAVNGKTKGSLIRSLLSATVRQKPDVDDPLVARLADLEKELLEELRRPSDDEWQHGLRHAVAPVFAAAVTFS